MIWITNNIRTRYPSAFRKARRERVRCVWLEEDLAYVSRRAAGHGQYLVRFHTNQTGVTVECQTLDKDPCKGCWQDRMCIHIAVAIERGITRGRAAQRKAA